VDAHLPLRASDTAEETKNCRPVCAGEEAVGEFSSFVTLKGRLPLEFLSPRRTAPASESHMHWVVVNLDY